MFVRPGFDGVFLGIGREGGRWTGGLDGKRKMREGEGRGGRGEGAVLHIHTYTTSRCILPLDMTAGKPRSCTKRRARFSHFGLSLRWILPRAIVGENLVPMSYGVHAQGYGKSVDGCLLNS